MGPPRFEAHIEFYLKVSMLKLKEIAGMCFSNLSPLNLLLNNSWAIKIIIEKSIIVLFEG
jgi:uncharacterized protein YbcC (UPF0753/DUF2309 family)